jgi:hypothetical protein
LKGRGKVMFTKRDKFRRWSRVDMSTRRSR